MSLVKLLKDLPDARRGQGRLYSLDCVLLCSILSVLCGARSYRDIHRFIDTHLRRLNEIFGMNWKRAPAHTTLQVILSGVSHQVLEWYFRQHIQGLDTGESKRKMAIAIDGKALRGSFDNLNNKSFLTLISAYCSDSDLILGHIETEGKGNEILAVQKLLAGFGMKDCVYTIDAMHCQKKLLI